MADIVLPSKRRCKKCLVIKPITAFPRKSKKSEWREWRCQECNNKAVKKIRERDRAAYNAYMVAWRAEHPGYHKKYAEYDRLRSRERYRQNPEYFSQWAKDHREERNATATRRRREDPKFLEITAAATKRWKLKNPEKVKSREHRRRALEAGADGNHTGDDIKRIFKQQKGRCGYCRKSIKNGYHIDHIVALARGGSNHSSNIQLLCPPCNLSKNDSDPIDFAQKLGFLI